MNFTVVANVSQFFEAFEPKFRKARLKGVYRAMQKAHLGSISADLHKKDTYRDSLHNKAQKAFKIINTRRDPRNQQGSPSVYNGAAGFSSATAKNHHLDAAADMASQHRRQGDKRSAFDWHGYRKAQSKMSAKRLGVRKATFLP